MMSILEINKYSHEITKINIHNDNLTSDNDDPRYKMVTVKINIHKNQNETIRFSTTIDGKNINDWLAHQSNGNDYFLRIRNEPNSICTIYAHFFPAELYDYTEDKSIVDIYNFSDLFEENPTEPWHNNRYPIQIKSEGYEMIRGSFNKPLIRSLLNNSVDKYKNPNYKNYIHTGTDDSDMTEQGRFPLSSRYRPSKYVDAPQFNQFTLPHWEKANIDVSNCKRQGETPYWEVKIHRTGLSDKITNEVIDNVLDTDYPDCENLSDDECRDKHDMPINVYLNYQYLPSSTEYHQHYFGFEGTNIKTNDGSLPMKFGNSNPAEFADKIKNGEYEQQTANKTYTVLDGEGLEKISNQFNKSTTYRLINYGDPFDERYTVGEATDKTPQLKHENIHNIDLDTITLQKQNCEFERNTCKKYWTYKPTGTNNSVYYTLSVKADTYYVFKYFIYIPADAYVEEDSCYITIRNTSDNEIIGELEEVFKAQDKKLRHQWIYHEIPFYTTTNEIQIVIKGPQHDMNGPNIDISYENEHECKHDVIHFVSMQIAEMVEYSPTVKYTRTGMYLVEGYAHGKKPLSSSDDICVENASDSAIEWVSNTEELPIPLGDVFIFFDGDFDILYNENTTEIRWTDSEDFVFHFDDYNEIMDTEIKWETDDSIIKLKYDEIYDNINNESWDAIADDIQTWINNTKAQRNDTENPNVGELGLFRKQQKVFTTGINNEFSILLSDAYGNIIDEGIVECSIHERKDESAKIKELGEQTPNKDGIVTYKRLNFKGLKPSQNEYYLKIKYTHRCYNKTIIQWKKIIFIEEHRNMQIFTNTGNNYCQSTSNECELHASSIYEDDEYKLKESKPYTINKAENLPLRLDVYITNQLGTVLDDGYCELSIDDKVIQSTIIDNKGIANFYIDSNDISKDGNSIQTVKIEHFTKYNESINFAYFILQTASNYDGRPNIPIHINALDDDAITQLAITKTSIEYKIDRSVLQQETVLFNIDTEDNKNFSITIQKNNNPPEVYQITDNDIELAFVAEYDKEANRDTDTYTIITDDLPNSLTNQYRRTKKTIIIKWN